MERHHRAERAPSGPSSTCRGIRFETIRDTTWLAEDLSLFVQQAHTPGVLGMILKTQHHGTLLTTSDTLATAESYQHDLPPGTAAPAVEAAFHANRRRVQAPGGARPPFSSATMPPRSRPGQGRGPWIEAHAPRRFHPIDRGGVSPPPLRKEHCYDHTHRWRRVRQPTPCWHRRQSRQHETHSGAQRNAPANRPNVDITRARAYTKVYRATEGMPSLMRRYKASAEVYRTLTDNVYDYEQLVGWPTKRIRGPTSPLSSTPTGWPMTCPTSDRTYDPFEITDEDYKELEEDLLPYWKDKTMAVQWGHYVSKEEWNRGQFGGVSDVSNYLCANGSHFIPRLDRRDPARLCEVL